MVRRPAAVAIRRSLPRGLRIAALLAAVALGQAGVDASAARGGGGADDAGSDAGPTEVAASDVGPGADASGAPSGWRHGASAGVSVWLNTGSSALPHLFDPALRAHGLYALDDRLELGVELAAVATGNPNYRLIGGYLLARAGLVRASAVRFDLRVGLGLGTSPRILSPDLEAEGTVAPWGQLGVELAWRVTPAVDLWIGLIGEHLGVVTLTVGAELGL